MSNNKTDLVVVFGSVTSAAYQHLRVAMLNEGLHPTIVRMGDSTSESALDEEYDDLEAAKAAVIKHYFKGVPMTSVKAFIMPYESPEQQVSAPNGCKWGWIVDQFDTNVAEYNVQIHESDGSQYLAGCGFGSVLPPLGNALEDYKTLLQVNALFSIDDE